ncbi:MAG TPA: MurR/RpiR family transcriptional regulator [Burkholderiales bacterium]|nr:MurR/RpiR family transcriptional regulator [Burkholderiales bacterium]
MTPIGVDEMKDVSKTAAKSETYDDLRQAIIERHPALSKTLRQIATYALDNPSEMALETIAAVAPRADVQPSSLIRFAKAFGFSGYSEMQRVFRTRLTESLPDYKERLRLLGDSRPPANGKDVGTLLEQFVQADIAGLEALVHQENIHDLMQSTIDLILKAETVYLVAHRRSFPLTCYLSYALSQLNVRNVLVDGVGGMFFQQVGHATAKDLVFAVSTKSYSPDVVQVVREMAQRKIPVVAMTDSPLSPIAEHATLSLEVPQASVQMFRSLAAPMTLSIALIVGLGRALEAKAARRLSYK